MATPEEGGEASWGNPASGKRSDSPSAGQGMGSEGKKRRKNTWAEKRTNAAPSAMIALGDLFEVRCWGRREGEEVPGKMIGKRGKKKFLCQEKRGSAWHTRNLVYIPALAEEGGRCVESWGGNTDLKRGKEECGRRKGTAVGTAKRRGRCGGEGKRTVLNREDEVRKKKGGGKSVN